MTSYQWYHCGKDNIKIKEGDFIPEGFVKGYALKLSLKKRLAKLEKRYIKKMQIIEEFYMNKIKMAKEKLTKKWVEEQQKITPF